MQEQAVLLLAQPCLSTSFCVSGLGAAGATHALSTQTLTNCMKSRVLSSLCFMCESRLTEVLPASKCESPPPQRPPGFDSSASLVCGSELRWDRAGPSSAAVESSLFMAVFRSLPCLCQ